MILRRDTAGTVAGLALRSVAVLVAASAVAFVLTTPTTELRIYAPVAGRAIPAEANGSAAAETAKAETNYSDIAAHPLFYPTRTPWVPPAPPAEAPVETAPSPLTNYMLVGVIVSGTDRSALIRSSGDGKTIMLGEGQELEGWTLREITRERLYFASGDATYEMPLVKPSESGR